LTFETDETHRKPYHYYSLLIISLQCTSTSEHRTGVTVTAISKPVG